jgi:DMSO/TMAO reductase YedYZ molybdopterin-dependent catalytic subunit
LGTDVGDVELHDNMRDVKMYQNFARRMSLADAISPDNMLCYEMNGEALPESRGFPVRLIAPGWYGSPMSNGSSASKSAGGAGQGHEG